LVSILHSMLLHDKQKEIASSPARFKTIRAGRKGGKTALEVETISLKATASVERLNLSKKTFASGRKVIYIAPTQLQARNIVVSSPLLTGIISFKSSYGPLRVEKSIVALPNVHYLNNVPLVSDYKNLRSQCVFTLAALVNDHKIGVKAADEMIRSHIIEELSNYQDASIGDGKRMATQKDDIKAAISRSPDITDTMIMRMYFELTNKLLPDQSEVAKRTVDEQNAQFNRNAASQEFEAT
jgi:hypothetical protein